MTEHACTCGYQAEDLSDLTAHFGEMFVPADDTAPDGQAHFEASSDKDKDAVNGTPAVILTCRCGFTAPLGEFDQHLLDVFAPADRIGPDGRRHAPAAAGDLPVPAAWRGRHSRQAPWPATENVPLISRIPVLKLADVTDGTRP